MSHDKPERHRYPLRRMLLSCLALAAGMAVVVWIDLESTRKPVETGNASAAGPTLADLVAGKLAIVDLAWSLNPQSAYWPGDNYKPFELRTIATLEKDGVLSKAFASPEHLGTHLDAANHFERERPSVDKIPAATLFAPGVVIDVSGAVSANADYLVSVEDIKRFEATHGRIPAAAVVLAYTGWSRFWDNPARYQGRDVMGRLHFPGFSSEAVEFLIAERGIRGVGLDTMSVDHGLSRDFPVHHVLGKASRYGLENLARLAELPARGFYLFVAPMKIETGSGGPVRVFAVFPREGAKSAGTPAKPNAADGN
ncbi:MAG TPA: cyclase family protein [Pirellulales bacterium]|nr:cyclase family protein [Pirellulales bacterium]